VTHFTTLDVDQMRDPTLDLGIVELGTIDGLVWIDLSNNGLPSDETLASAALSGITVRLYEMVNGERVFLQELLTDANGEFCFMGLPLGTYQVEYNPADLPE